MRQTVTLRTPVALVLAVALTSLGALLALRLRGGGSCSLRPLMSPRAPWSTWCKGTAAGSSGGWSGAPRIEIGAESNGTNDLWDYFQRHRKGPVIDKWHPYFDIYSRYFQRFRGRELRFLEIGIQSGGSIRMWQDYFGAERLKYVGVDVDVYTRELFADPPRVGVLIGDQGDAAFWQRVAQQHADGFDIILDDGGHHMKQQIATFESTWDLLRPGGVYICEDTATSMDFMMLKERRATTQWGGGFGKNDTWHEHAKRLADVVQGHYIDRQSHSGFDPQNRTDTLLSVAFYDQMVVLEKGPHPQARSSQAGTFRIPYGSRTINATQLAGFKAQLAESLKP